MNIILISLKETFRAVKNNKLIFILVIILQALFFLSIFLANYSLQLEAIEKAQETINYIGSLNFDEVSVGISLMQKSDLLGSNPKLIEENSKKIIENLKLMFAYTSIIMVIFCSVIWILAFKAGNKKTSLKLFIRLLLTFAVFLLFSGLVLFSAFKSSFYGFLSEELELSATFFQSITLLLILLYFLPIALAMPQNLSAREFFRKLFFVSIKKAHLIILPYLIIILLLSFLLLIAVFLPNIIMLAISLILTLFLLVISKIFLIYLIDRLVK